MLKACALIVLMAPIFARADVVVRTFQEPTHVTGMAVTFKFSEIVLRPGEALVFEIPKALRARAVTTVILAHRQDPADETGTEWTNGRDSDPGLSSVQVHATNFPESRAWRYWNGMASGKLGAKFAERRYEWEYENLYEWLDYGSTGVDSGDSSNDALMTDLVRVVSVGTDKVRVGELTVKFLPESSADFITQIFTSGTRFNDTPGRKAVFGGGQALKGTFPGALQLPYGPAQLPKGWTFSGGTLAIPIPDGRRVVAVEIAGGDSHPDKVVNKDGGWGTPGWSKVSFGIESSGAVTDWFVKHENVPPEGLILGAPIETDALSGRRVLIRAANDTFYVMGLRIGLK